MQKRNKNGQYGEKVYYWERLFMAFLFAGSVWGWNYIQWHFYATPIKVYVYGSQSPLIASQDAPGQVFESDVVSLVSSEEKSPVASNIDGILQQVGREEGIDWKILKAICLTESGCNYDRIGDNGQSFGAFQINKPSHPNLTTDEAFDFVWSAHWTAKHLKPYADNLPLAFKAHNGIGKTTNQWYIDRCMSYYTTI